MDTNQIDDDGVAQLAGMMAVNKSIRTLNLAANRIGDVGMAALAEMLKCNSTLKELDLSSNEVGYDGTVLPHSCSSACLLSCSLNQFCDTVGRNQFPLQLCYRYVALFVIRKAVASLIYGEPV